MFENAEHCLSRIQALVARFNHLTLITATFLDLKTLRALHLRLTRLAEG